jgi:hypothetical protein
MCFKLGLPDSESAIQCVGSVRYGDALCVLVGIQIWQVPSQAEVGLPGTPMDVLLGNRVTFFEPLAMCSVPLVKYLLKAYSVCAGQI